MKGNTTTKTNISGEDFKDFVQKEKNLTRKELAKKLLNKIRYVWLNDADYIKGL